MSIITSIRNFCDKANIINILSVNFFVANQQLSTICAYTKIEINIFKYASMITKYNNTIIGTSKRFYLTCISYYCIFTLVNNWVFTYIIIIGCIDIIVSS